MIRLIQAKASGELMTTRLGHSQTSGLDSSVQNSTTGGHRGLRSQSGQRAESNELREVEGILRRTENRRTSMGAIARLTRRNVRDLWPVLTYRQVKTACRATTEVPPLSSRNAPHSRW